LVSLVALTGITSVLLVLMLSQPRVWLAMARDGLVPKSFFGAVHDKYRTPWKSTILTGVIVALSGSLLPLRILAELTNIGTLFAFVVVCAAVLVMRRTHPNADRPFRAPLVPLTPILGILICLLLMFSLPAENWLRCRLVARHAGLSVRPPQQRAGGSWRATEVARRRRASAECEQDVTSQRGKLQLISHGSRRWRIARAVYVTSPTYAPGKNRVHQRDRTRVGSEFRRVASER
jgi:hypothetical protein